MKKLGILSLTLLAILIGCLWVQPAQACQTHDDVVEMVAGKYAGKSAHSFIDELNVPMYMEGFNNFPPQSNAEADKVAVFYHQDHPDNYYVVFYKDGCTDGSAFIHKEAHEAILKTVRMSRTRL